MAHRYLGPPLTQHHPFALAAHAPPRAAPACHTHESAARPSRHHTKKMKRGVPSTRARRARERPRRSPSHHAWQARARPCAPPPPPREGRARCATAMLPRGRQGPRGAGGESRDERARAACWGRKMPLKKKTYHKSSRFRGPERENAERANPTISRPVEHFALAPAGAIFSFREGFWGCFSFSFLNGGAAAGAPGHTRCARGRAAGELRCGGGGGWGTRRRSSAHVGGPGA